MSCCLDYRLYFILAVFCTVDCMSQQERLLSSSEMATVENGIRKMNESTSSISASFRQEKNIVFLTEKVKSSGQFYYKKEDKIRWEYISPSPYLIIINEGKVFIDNEREKRSFDGNKGRMFREMNEMIISCINGNIAGNEDYKVKYLTNGKDYIVSLVPESKTISGFVKEIRLVLNKENYSVDQIKMIESADGDYTHIVFEKKKFNSGLDPGLFSGF